VLTHLSFYHLNFAQLQTAHLTFVAANCLVATLLTREQAIEFLGQINMLAVITTLLLMPAVVAGGLVAAMQPIIILYLVILTAFITREYFRRMNYANMVFKHRRIIIFNLFCLVAFLAYVFH